MVISSDELYEFIATARNSGWSFLSLDEVASLLNQKKPLRKIFSLTFDDGYLDNLTLAAPLLTSLGVPFAVFVVPDFIQCRELPWWYQLEAILDTQSFISLPDGKSYSLDSVSAKHAAFLDIRSKLMHDHLKSILIKRWLRDFDVSSWSKESRLFMNWSELAELASSANVTIGAHGLTHEVLTHLSLNDVIDEISESKNILEQNLGIKINHFAYPYGSHVEAGPREYAVARRLNFRTALTTNPGAINSFVVDTCSLPRMFLGPSSDLQAIRRAIVKTGLKNLLFSV